MLLFEISGMTMRAGILSAGEARHPVTLSVSEESLSVRGVQAECPAGWQGVILSEAKYLCVWKF